MQDVDGIRELRHVDYPMPALMHDSDLANTRSDRWHRFSVCRLQSVLNPIQLITGFTIRVRRKATKHIEGAAAESNVLHGHLYLYIHIYLFKYQL